METFNIRIADTAIGIQASFGSTGVYFQKYRTDALPEFSVSASGVELVQEQDCLNEEADREGLRRRVFTEPFLERAVLQRKIAQKLLPQDILLLHGSTIAMDGCAYLFTASCGVGKSTHTRLWREVFGQRVQIINDDRAFLKITPDGVLAYGSPWSGKHGLDSNICAPLKGICILERGEENQIHTVSPELAYPMIQKQVFLPHEACCNALDALTNALLRSIPLWQMRCTKEPEAAQIAHAAMSK